LFSKKISGNKSEINHVPNAQSKMCSYNDACETQGCCKKIQSLYVGQRFYVPIHNYFGTLSIEIVNKTSNKKFAGVWS
jgi:hypothetical protein